MFPVGGLCGALASGKLADRFGRKRVFLIMDMIHIISSVVVATSHFLVQLLIGRLLTGIGSGIATVICGLYIKEVSPPEVSGKMGSLVQINISLGILMAVIFGKLLLSDPQWRFGIIAPGTLSLMRLFLYGLYFPESPEWLRKRGMIQKAERVELTLGISPGTKPTTATSNTTKIETTTSSIPEHSLAAPESILTSPSISTSGVSSIPDSPSDTEVTVGSGSSSNSPVDTAHEHSEIEYGELLFFTLSLPAVVQLSGIGAVIYFSAEILQETSGMDSWSGSVLLMTAFFLGSFVILCFIDTYGRRPLLLVSTAGIGATCISLTVMLIIHMDVSVTVCLVAFMIFFEIGLGPLPFFYIAELSPIEHRGEMMSYGFIMMWLCNGAVAFSTPLLVPMMGNYIFVPFGVVSIIGASVIYFCFPETKTM